MNPTDEQLRQWLCDAEARDEPASPDYSAGFPHYYEEQYQPTLAALFRELLGLRTALAAIKAADPDLFDPAGGDERGAAYETYGSAGHDLRQAYLAAVKAVDSDG